MDFKTLHLEEMVVLPADYKEIITDRREITSELKEKGFGGGVWGKDRRYNHLAIDLEPFLIRVTEKDVAQQEPSDLEYQVEFQVDNTAFAPFLKFIKEEGKKRTKKGSKLNVWFDSWLDRYFDFSPENDYSLLTEKPTNRNELVYIVKSEVDLYKLLIDLSKGFRALAIDHAADPFDLVAEFEYDDAELKGREYWDLANEILTPMVTRGLIEGLAAFRKSVESGLTNETEISIEVKKQKKLMLFYYSSECKGTPFYEFEIGKVLSTCLSLMRSEDLEYEQELSHWFTDAVHNLPEKAYTGLNVTIEVPETGGDPVFEHIN